MGINDPLGRIEALEQEQKQLKEEVRRLKEQQTEPIRIGRLEIEQKDVQITLDNHTEFLKEISDQSDLHTQAFMRVETLLKEHTETLDERGRQLTNLVHQSIKTQSDIAALRTDMEKRTDAIAETMKAILARLPEKGE